MIDRRARRLALRVTAAWALVAGTALALTLSAHPAYGQSFGLSTCMGTFNCTSNDLTFVSTGLGTVDDGCVGPGDEVTIFLQTVVRNSTAQTRYDVGLFYSRQGVSAQTDAQCYRAIMNPVGTGDDFTCQSGGGSLDLLGGSGPYLNADGRSGQTPVYDACGDILDQEGGGTGCDDDLDGLWDDSVIRFAEPMTFPCNDTEVTPDGYVNIATCLSFANQPGQIGTGNPVLCNSIADIGPGTSAKCKCDPGTPSDIPRADVSLTCNAFDPPDGVAGPGESIIREFTYTNACICAPDTGLAEADQCCTVAYLRIPLTYDATRGEVVRIETTGGSYIDDGNGTIFWTPTSGNGTAGIIGPDQSATLSYTYTFFETATDGVVSFTGTGEWARDASGTGGWKTQTVLNESCPVELSTTWATVTDVTARVDGARAAIEWRTAAEAGTTGFHLERRDTGDDPWVRVTDRALPATGAVPGGVYRYVDTGVANGSTPTYRVIEVDAAGGEHLRAEIAATPAILPAGGDDPRPAPFVRSRAPRAERIAARTAATAGDPAAGGSWRSGGTRLPGVARVRLEVADSGLFRVPVDRIAAVLGIPAARVDAAVTAGRIRITGAEGDVPWTAAADGVVFHGVARSTPHTDRGVYFLDLGRGVAMAPDSLAGPSGDPPAATFRETLELERDLVAYPYFATSPTDDFWFWAAVMSHSPPADVAEAVVELPGAVADGDPAEIEVRLRQVTDLPGAPDVRAAVVVNGTRVGVVESDLPGDASLPVPVPASVLADGRNEIRVEGEIGTFLLDGFTVRYERRATAVDGRLTVPVAAGVPLRAGGFATSDLLLVDLAAPGAPTVVEPPQARPDGAGGWEVVVTANRDRRLAIADPAALPEPHAIAGDVASDLGAPRNRADYVVIGPAGLLDSADALVDHRAAAGWTPMLVDVQDVYDEYSDGVRDPAAVGAFLRDATSAWSLPPRAAVILGRGTIDPHDRGSHGNLVPPALVMSLHGAVPSDSILGDVDDDGVPEIAVGRLPVLDAPELEDYVARVIAAEAEGAAGWRSRTVIAADDADASGEFDADAATLAALAPGEVEQILLGLPDTPSEARARLLSEIDRGAAVVTWIGHGGVTQLASEGVLRVRDVRSLDNGPRMPVVAALTCYINHFADPATTSLGEELVLHAGGGAAAVWAATGPSSNGRAVRVGEKLYQQLFRDGEAVLGDAIVGALEAAVAEGTPPEALATYTLLGDPGFAVLPSGD